MRHPLTVCVVSLSAVLWSATLVGCGKERAANSPAAQSAPPSDAADDNAVVTETAVADPSDAQDPADQPSEVPTSSPAADSDQPTPAGSALSSIFSPARAPERKTMGLLQRSFLDIAAEGDQELEVAIVIDGTQSMARDLEGVRNSIKQMLDDLRKYRDNEVRAAIVIYRDHGSPSGEYSIPQKIFTDDKETIEAAIQKLTPESGAPYFHELPDLGIHMAIYDLPWTLDDQVAKWILLFGDAPPYAESRSEQDPTKGFRRFATAGLVGAAKAKGIRINCVLCTSGDDESGSYEKSLDETRTFMTQLAGGTDGLMLDLSYPQIRTALIEAGKQPERQYAKIDPIDLAAVMRDDMNAGNENKIKTVSVAILPHMNLDNIQKAGIKPAEKAVQVATALRTRLGQVSGVRVASPVEIQRQLRRFNARNLSERQRLRGLAGRLGVDYIVWGEAVDGGASYQTAAYRRDDGKPVVQNVNLPGDSDQGTWAHIFLTAASDQADEEDDLGKLLGRVNDPAAMQQPMSKSPTTSAELLEALEALDQALEYDTRSDQSKALLETADRASQAAATAEPRNALAHWLQANVAYNQAAHLFTLGESDAAKKRMEEMKTSLEKARRFRDSVKIPSLKTEIEADYLLIKMHDIPPAVARYIKMTGPSYPLSSQLRGHWMLSGIYAGDWGNAQGPLVDPAKARMHIIEIMANWPDSPQAALLKRWLKYDETTKQTEYNYLPMVNIELSGI